MGKSLFMSYEAVISLQRSLDNFLIAKILDDVGSPLPPDTEFYTRSSFSIDDTVFLKAVSSLFGGVLCTSKAEPDYEEKVELSIHIPLVEEWVELTKGSELSPRVLEDHSYIMDPVNATCCDYFDLNMECFLVPFGLEIQITGGPDGFFHNFIKGMIEFKKRLQEKVADYEKRREMNGRNSNYPTGRIQVCSSSKAV